jgi:hypothetical protein
MTYRVEFYLVVALIFIAIIILITLRLKKVAKGLEETKLVNQTPEEKCEAQEPTTKSIPKPISNDLFNLKTNGEDVIGAPSLIEPSSGSLLKMEEIPQQQDSLLQKSSQKMQDQKAFSNAEDSLISSKHIGIGKKVYPESRGGKYIGTEGKSPPSHIETTFEKMDEWGCFLSYVCTRRPMEWRLEVEIEPKDQHVHIVSALQDAIELETTNESTCYTLRSISSPLCIVLERNGIEKRYNPATLHFPILFRIEAQNKAVHSSSLSEGEYLVLTPDSWLRNDSLAGTAAISPEHTNIPHIIAHYFYLNEDGDHSISFFDHRGKEININSRRKGQFVLEGDKLAHDKESGIEYYANSFPFLRYRKKSVDDMATFEGTLVFGINEGSTPSRVRYSQRFNRENSALSRISLQNVFNEHEESASEKPPTGKYYVRIYDHEDILLESFAFYFIAKHFAFEIENNNMLPETDGHKPIIVKFYHEADCSIFHDTNHAGISVIKNTEETTVFKLDPSCSRERMLFTIEFNGYSLPLPLYIPKLWWAIQQNRESNQIWQDCAAELSRNDYSASSETKVILYVPEMLHDVDISIGFNIENKKSYNRHTSKSSIEINLRDFGDDPCLLIPGVHDFKLWVKEKQKRVSVTLCRATVKLACCACNFISINENEMISHYFEYHLHNDLINLSYDELRMLQTDLPARIYQCNYCGYYVAETIEQHATTEICRHIEEFCPNVNHNSLELTNKCFRVVTNPEEIKQNVFKTLELHRKCKYCNEIIDEENIFIDHLISKHGKKMVYKLR